MRRNSHVCAQQIRCSNVAHNNRRDATSLWVTLRGAGQGLKGPARPGTEGGEGLIRGLLTTDALVAGAGQGSIILAGAGQGFRGGEEGRC